MLLSLNAANDGCRYLLMLQMIDVAPLNAADAGFHCLWMLQMLDVAFDGC